MWTTYAVLWVVGTLAVIIFWQLDFFRPILFSSPVWITLLVSLSCGVPSLRKTSLHMAIMFLTYWSVIQSYPVQCRNAWGAAMVQDNTYWKNDEAIAKALIRQEHEFFPKLPVNTSMWSRLTTPKKPPFLKQHFNESDVNLDSAEKVLAMFKAQHPESNDGEKWVMPWTRGDTLENFELRAYCDLHQHDHRLPHVYPLRVFGINTHEVSISAPCPFWTCVLTEARPGGKLGFLWILAVPMALHALHHRCPCQWRPLIYTLGTGRCRLWWIWFWATLLPFWAVMLIKSWRDTELIPFFVEEITVLFELRKWFLGRDTEQDNEHLAVFVLIIVGGVLLYVFRDRVRKELGLEELVPLLFNWGSDADRHTFQLCIWRVEVHAEGGPVMESGMSSQTDANPQEDVRTVMRLPRPQLPSSSWGAAYACLPSLSLSRSAEADGFTLHGRDGQPPRSISVHFCYGAEEVQRTRTQRMSYSNDVAVYDFYENFTVSVEPRPNVEFRVDVREESGSGDTLGSLSFPEGRLNRQFLRSKGIPRERMMSLADEQLIQMRQAKAPAQWANNDELFKKMGKAGFAFHKLPNGGAVWLAFCELNEDSPGFCCA